MDGPVTRTMESKALGHNIKHIDIFSASWGPPDNGRSMDGPKGITMLVIEQAIEKVCYLYNVCLYCSIIIHILGM